MGGGCSAYGEMRNAYKILVEKPEERTSFGRLRRMPKWEYTDTIKIGYECVDWIHMARDSDQ
jgi:hypothetical protein